MKDLDPKVNKVKWIDRIIVYCIIFALIIGGVLFIFQATLRIFGIFWGQIGVGCLGIVAIIVILIIVIIVFTKY